MKIRERIQKEKVLIPLMLKGYSRHAASAWYSATLRDLSQYKNTFGEKTLRALHKQGYLGSSKERYCLQPGVSSDYITDFSYITTAPYNNSFSKWLDDILTTNRVLKQFKAHNREIYFSIIQRYMQQMILRVGQEDREYSVQDILELVREKGKAELRPVHWASTKRRYYIAFKEERFYLNGKPTEARAIERIVNGLRSNYILAEPVHIRYSFSKELSREHSIKLWIANDFEGGPTILSGVVDIYWTERNGKRKRVTKLLDIQSGSFELNNQKVNLKDWNQIKAQVRKISASIKQISYYTMTIALQEDTLFKILHLSANPRLPEVAFHKELNEYLKQRAAKKLQTRVTLSQHIKNLKASLFNKFVGKFCRKGIRPYMQKLWFEAVKSDFLHTKVSLSKKIWAWKRGFISYHTYQYGLTEENYKNYLSDYDYYWLNRINNEYQKWVNDKTTYRYIMDPFKEYVPAYYFSCFKRGGTACLAKMWDCPEKIRENLSGLLTLLRAKGKLAFKPSAGTHGDGFYCLSYENGAYFVNGVEHTVEQLQQLLNSQKSFYVVTEYLEMHPRLKEIYPKSVNTVRMMVINKNGYDPQIMQTYMRIGSSSTGYTDNVGYGGICVMVDPETGELYQPQTIKEHIYYDCPTHPDTGTPISGLLPNWDLVCEKVLAISRYLCELEYLGFDVAITEEGFCVLEINIHQDLHKVNCFSEEINEFFRKKIAYKKR